MSLEAYTGNISDLVDSNPTPTDPKSQGDDHLRGIKYTLKQTFPNFDGPLSAARTPFTPSGNVAANNVQAAIQELDTEKVSKSGDTMTGPLTVQNSTYGNPPVDVFQYSYFASASNNAGLTGVGTTGALGFVHDNVLSGLFTKEKNFVSGSFNASVFVGASNGFLSQPNNDGTKGFYFGYGSSAFPYSARITLNGDGVAYDTDADIAHVFTKNSYSAYATVTGSINNISDYRIKENVEPMVGALERVALLKPIRFHWAEGSISGNTWGTDAKVDGFIAHEVTPVVPEAVNGEKDAVNTDGTPKLQGVDYAKIVPLLTAAVQELSAKLDTALSRIAELEAR